MNMHGTALTDTRRSQTQISVDSNAIIVVYQLGDADWRGFSYPYGETTEAESKEGAIEKIRELTAAYARTCAKYGSPSHLVNSGLMDDNDKEVIYQIIGNKEYMDKIHSKEGIADLDPYYAEAYRV